MVNVLQQNPLAFGHSLRQRSGLPHKLPGNVSAAIHPQQHLGNGKTDERNLRVPQTRNVWRILTFRVTSGDLQGLMLGAFSFCKCFYAEVKHSLLSHHTWHHPTNQMCALQAVTVEQTKSRSLVWLYFKRQKCFTDLLRKRKNINMPKCLSCHNECCQKGFEL